MKLSSRPLIAPAVVGHWLTAMYGKATYLSMPEFSGSYAGLTASLEELWVILLDSLDANAMEEGQNA